MSYIAGRQVEKLLRQLDLLHLSNAIEFSSFYIY